MSTDLRNPRPHGRRYRNITVLMPTAFKAGLARLVSSGAFPSLAAAIRTAVEEALRKGEVGCIQVWGREDLTPVSVFLTPEQAEALLNVCGSISSGVRGAVQRMVEEACGRARARMAIPVGAITSMSYEELRTAVERAAQKVLCQSHSKRASIWLRKIKEALGMTENLPTYNSLLSAVLAEVLDGALVERIEKNNKMLYIVDVEKFCGRR